MTSLSNLTDQELNELATVECRGWTFKHKRDSSMSLFIHPVRIDDKWGVASKGYNPCKNAEQAIYLAEKYEMEICFSDKLVSYKDYSHPSKEREYSWNQLQFKTGDWKRAVVIAAILSERGE